MEHLNETNQSLRAEDSATGDHLDESMEHLNETNQSLRAEDSATGDHLDESMEHLNETNQSLRALDSATGDHLDELVELLNETNQSQSDRLEQSFDISNRSFDDPVELLESSIEDEGAMDEVHVDEEPQPITFRIHVEGTKRQKKKLTDSRGYTYNVKRTGKVTVDWQCSVRSKTNVCRATVKQKQDDFTIGHADHTHPAIPGTDIAVAITTQVRRVAREQVFSGAGGIVEAIMDEHSELAAPTGSRPKQANLTRMVNRVRQRLRPSDPVDLDFELEENFIPENFLQKDIAVEGQRHLLFATARQLQILSRVKTWYVDGTFKVVRRPFTQLWSVHGFIRSGEDIKQIPLIFCLMSRRRKIDYKKVLRALYNSLPEEPVVQLFVADFEAAFWKAAREVFPEMVIRGCAFHWGQAINRKVQEIGLQTAYQQDRRIHGFVRKILALPFLPAEHIRPAFECLVERAEGIPALTPLLVYVDNTWVRSSIWNPAAWSVFMQHVRTNNDVEGWHRRLNMKACDSKPPMYVLVQLLHKEASLLPLQFILVSEGKLKRRHSKRSNTAEASLFKLWEYYQDDELTVSQLLKKCAELYGLN